MMIKYTNDTTIGIIALAGIGTLVATESIPTAILAAIGTVGMVYAYAQGWFEVAGDYSVMLLHRLTVWIRSLGEREETAVYQPHDILLGKDPITGAADVENLASLGHIGIYGTTRYGKTTWLHSIIHHMIANHPPSELRLYISDPKTVDYPFYGRLPYLNQPIARNPAETNSMIDHVIDQMKQRAALFAPYAATVVCNNLDRYAEHSGERLPRIVVIFDELADVVQPGSKLEDKLIRLAKLGLAYGIHLILATQRPSSKVVTGEIKSQMASKFVTWMPSNREYGVVSELPKELYLEMPRARGRFMAYTSKGWRYIQGIKIPDKQLERMAASRSGRQRVWASDATASPTAVSPPSPWGGSDNDKIRLILNYKDSLGRWPSISETVTQFSITKPTAIKYRKMAGFEPKKAGQRG